MVPDDGVDFVYMIHVLEHVSHLNIETTLREVQRILKSGGVLRISVPDFDKIIGSYKDNNLSINSIEQPLMGGKTVLKIFIIRSSMLRNLVDFSNPLAWKISTFGMKTYVTIRILLAGRTGTTRSRVTNFQSA
jgi:2-polyprenyl-3-methyl-5-hydroxy-6-metoxy-1,4-benzoquinol methylase